MSDRAARSRLDVVSLAAVVLPVLTLLAALGVHAGVPGAEPAPPTEEPLTATSIVCPPGGDELVVAAPVTGTALVRTGGIEREVEVGPGRAPGVGVGAKAAVITVEGDAAQGLVAGRFARPLASLDCRAPVFDQWFTGLGAGAKHQSTLQLTNPDAGRSVVDVLLYGRRGPIEAPQLRGIAVRGGESRTFDLAALLPRRDDLVARVVTVRGRITANVLDTFTEIGGAGESGTDSLPGQEEPATTNLLLGLPGGPGQRTLVLANTTADEGRATVRLVTGESTFTPAGVDEVVLPPESVVRVPLAGVLRGAGAGEEADRPLGIEVESTVAATAGLVMFVDGDLTHAVPTAPLDATATTPLPAGRKQLVVGGAEAQGVVTVRSWKADGTELDKVRGEVAVGGGLVLDLPGAARLVTIEPRSTPLSAVVVVTGDGATLVRPRIPPASSLVPSVEPGPS